MLQVNQLAPQILLAEFAACAVFLHCGTGHSASAQADNFTRCPALQADPGPDEEGRTGTAWLGQGLSFCLARPVHCTPTQAPSQLQGGTVYVRDHQDMQFIRRAIDKKKHEAATQSTWVTCSFCSSCVVGNLLVSIASSFFH